MPQADPLGVVAGKGLASAGGQRHRTCMSELGPVRPPAGLSGVGISRGSQLRASQRDRDHLRVCVISVCCIHPGFLSGFYGEVRPSEAGGYSSLAYRLVGYADPVRAGRVSHALGIGLLAYALRRQPSAWLIWVSVA